MVERVWGQKSVPLSRSWDCCESDENSTLSVHTVASDLWSGPEFGSEVQYVALYDSSSRMQDASHGGVMIWLD